MIWRNKTKHVKTLPSPSPLKLGQKQKKHPPNKTSQLFPLPLLLLPESQEKKSEGEVLCLGIATSPLVTRKPPQYSELKEPEVDLPSVLIFVLISQFILPVSFSFVLCYLTAYPSSLSYKSELRSQTQKKIILSNKEEKGRKKKYIKKN